MEQLLDFEKAHSSSTQPTHKSSKQFWTFIKCLLQESLDAALLRCSRLRSTGKIRNSFKIINSVVFLLSESILAPSLGTSPHPQMPDIEVKTGGVHKLPMLTSLTFQNTGQWNNTHPYGYFPAFPQYRRRPPGLATGDIVHIFEKGDKYKPSNYCPVSLTTIYSKLI